MNNNEWKVKKLSDLADYINGFAFKPEDWGKDGLPIIRIEQLKNPTTIVDYFSGHLDEKNIIHNGDLIFSWSASLFLRIWQYGDAALNQHLFKVVEKEWVDRVLLKYFIEFYLPEMTKVSHGSTMQHITRKELSHFCAPFPSKKPEQSKIAEILYSVDRAIEQTEALITKQQRIKTGLMQDLLTRGIDENGNIRSEETHQFKDSPLGRIPVEWKVSRLSELANVERGKFTHRPRDDARFYGGPYPFIQTGDVTAHVGRFVNTYHQTLSQKGTSVSKEFPMGTIAITIAANIADTAILGQPMFFPDSVVGAVVHKPNSIRYVELTIRRWKPILEILAPQSAQRNINLEVLRPLLIAVPTIAEQNRISEVYEKVESVQIQLECTLNKLYFLKTALMQDLLTGNVRVTPLLEEESVPV